MTDWRGFGRFVFFSVLFFLGGVALYYQNRPVGLALILSGVGGQVLVSVLALWEQRNNEIDNRRELVRARMAFGIAATQWDDETRHFLAREWPEMGVEFGDDQIMYILDDGVNTGILIPFLREFLQDSSENRFAELRSYNDDKRIQERFNVSRDVVRLQWKKCTEFLEYKGYLQEESMAGNQTWAWRSPEHYKIMRRRYLNFRPLQEMRA